MRFLRGMFTPNGSRQEDKCLRQEKSIEKNKIGIKKIERIEKTPKYNPKSSFMKDIGWPMIIFLAWIIPTLVIASWIFDFIQTTMPWLVWLIAGFVIGVYCGIQSEKESNEEQRNYIENEDEDEDEKEDE